MERKSGFCTINAFNRISPTYCFEILLLKPLVCVYSSLFDFATRLCSDPYNLAPLAGFFNFA